MLVTEIIRQADELGIDLSVDEGMILYQPKSAATPEFVEALRQNKTTIIDELALLERLIKGQTWLTGCVDDFVAGTTSATPVTMPEMLDLWVRLEIQLRNEYGYVACIHGNGERCPEDGQVLCDGCI